MPWDYRQQEPEKPPKGRKVLLWAAMGLSLVLVIYGVIRLAGYGLDYFSAKETSRELREIRAQAGEAAEVTAAPAIPAEVPVITAEVSAGSPVPAEALLPAETQISSEAQNSAKAQAPVQTPEAVSPDTETGDLPQVTYPGGMKVNPKIQALRKKSEYIIGWLTMDDLDEPVVMKDNTYFLNHDVMGKRNDNGALFLDEQTEILNRPYTLLIYGHNMKTGAMFGSLRKYEDPAYCYRHRYISFDTLFETGSYEIFAVSVINLNPGLSRYLSLAALESPVKANRKEAIDTLQSLSSVPGLTKVNTEDQLLILVTCVGNDDERLVVAARRLEDE